MEVRRLNQRLFRGAKGTLIGSAVYKSLPLTAYVVCMDSIQSGACTNRFQSLANSVNIQ